MSHREPTSLVIAVRVYPDLKDERGPTHPPPRPEARMVFDTETRTDATQRLTFGSYRFIITGRCVTENLFYGDDLPAKDRRVLQRYTARHGAEVVDEGVPDLLP